MLPISISQTVPSFTPAAPALMLAALVLLHPCLMETQRYLIAQKSLRTCSGFSKHTWGPQCYLVHGCSTSASKFVQTHPPSSPSCSSSFPNWQSTPLKRQPPNHLHLCQTSLFGVFFSLQWSTFCDLHAISSSTGSTSSIQIYKAVSVKCTCTGRSFHIPI